MSEETFWRLTPAKLAYLVDRSENETRYEDSRFGMIVSTVLNMFGGKKGQPPVSPLSVMGWEDDTSPMSDPNHIPTQQEKEVAQKATALRFRLLQAGQKWRGGG